MFPQSGRMPLGGVQSGLRAFRTGCCRRLCASLVPPVPVFAYYIGNRVVGQLDALRAVAFFEP